MSVVAVAHEKRRCHFTADGRLAVAGATGTARLTPAERRILTALAERRGGLLPHAKVIEQVYQGMEPRDADGVVKVQVCRIRSELRAIGCDDLIVTVWGQGYRIAAETYEFEDPGQTVTVFLPPDDMRRLEGYCAATGEDLSAAVASFVADGLDAWDQVADEDFDW